MHEDTHLPYSRKGLEDLAAAMGVNSAYLWVNPTGSCLDVRQVKPIQNQTTMEQNTELEEEK